MTADLHAMAQKLADFISTRYGCINDVLGLPNTLKAALEYIRDESAKEMRENALTVKIPFPDWIRDPGTHDIFDMGMNAKNNAIRAIPLPSEVA